MGNPVRLIATVLPFVSTLLFTPTPSYGAQLESLPPVTHFASLPKIGQVSLTPDGSKLLILRAVGETYHATSFEMATKKNRMVMASDPEQFLFNWCHWATNERLVCSIKYYGTLQATQTSRRSVQRYRDGRITFTRLIAADYDGGNVLQLIESEQSTNRSVVWNPPLQDRVISWISEDSDHILIELNRDDRARPSVYRLNINTNELTRVRRHHQSVFRWYADVQGDVRIGLGFRNQKTVFYVTEGKGLRELDITHLLGVYPPEPLGFTADGKHMYLSSPNGGDRYGILRVSLDDPTQFQSLFTDADFDVFGGLELHPTTGEPIYVRYKKDNPVHHWFDDELQQKFDAVSRSIPAVVEEVVSADHNFSKFVIKAHGGVSPSFYFYDDAAKQLIQIGRNYPEISNRAIVDLTPMQYTARDGLSIPAYYAVPQKIEGSKSKKLATIVLPHGGPYARDSASFDYWVQFFLSRGYAVLKPNYRGSAGYGQAFLSAGFNQWGMSMQNDVIDGLDWMIKQGITDPDRVCIVGGSYGGYVALVAAYKTPERFRCAVSFAGITDISMTNTRMLNFDFGALRFGRIQRGDEARANSPLYHVDDISIPLLIVHGDVDRSVMVEQSRNFVAALIESDKPHRYIEQANGDHNLSIQSHRLELFEAMDTFLSKHLDPLHRPASPL